MRPPHLIAIVPAAGVGSRASSGLADPALAAVPKQYRLIAGQPMLRLAVKALLRDARITRVVVAVSPGDGWVAETLCGLDRVEWRPTGGATRADTVARTLADCDLHADDWVLVHDAARPGLPGAALRDLIDTCLQQQAGGLLAMPVADTIKMQSLALPGVRVDRTISREHLWQAQTPQMFAAGQLARALQSASDNALLITDEASAIEALGGAPLLVQGSLKNLKVTWPEDFDLMEKLIDDIHP